MPTIVTLLTDFGTQDGFVGAMKGVILTLAPTVQLVDLTHDIPPQDVRAGAWALQQAASTFPPGTIHVAVVDPGVGTARRPLLLADEQLFIGPDNGVLSWAAPPTSAGHVLDRSALHRETVSSTFHGRDVFAAVAGHLAAGAAPADCGTPTDRWQALDWPQPRVRGDRVLGQVVHVDRFGNLITNIVRGSAPAGRSLRVWVGTREVGTVKSTFGDVPLGEWVAYWGSGGTLEVAIRNGDAAAALGDTAGSVELCAQD